MKSTTIGLALGALNMATSKASLFEEDFQLADYDQVDFDNDLAEIADFDDDFQDASESDGRMLQDDEYGDEDDDDEPQRQRGRGGRGRRGGRGGRGKGRGGRGGRGKGRKGKKGGKNKKPFNFEEKMAKAEEQFNMKKEALPIMCQKKQERGKKICGMVESEADQDRCHKWISAKAVECEAYGECKVQMNYQKQKCSAQFKYYMQGIWKDDVQVPEAYNPEFIGKCFENSLSSMSECVDNSKGMIEEANAGFEPPTEEEIAAFKKAMKQQRKGGRGGKRRGRGRKQNRNKNKSKWQKKQWQKKRWEEQEETELSNDDGPADDEMEYEEEFDGLN